MLEPKVHKICKECNEEKILLEFSLQSDKCKKCIQKRKKPTMTEILRRNETLKLPGWEIRRKRAY